MITTAHAVYIARNKINDCVDSARCDTDLPALLRLRVRYFNDCGYRVLHDMIVVLKPLMDITIDEEGNLYITSSAVVPRLVAAKIESTH